MGFVLPSGVAPRASRPLGLFVLLVVVFIYFTPIFMGFYSYVCLCMFLCYVGCSTANIEY